MSGMQKPAEQAVLVRERLDVKWAIIDGTYTKRSKSGVCVPMIYSYWGFNLHQDRVFVPSDEVIEVDGDLMVRRSVLDDVVQKRLPEFRKEQNIDPYLTIKTQPYTEKRWKHLTIRFSYARRQQTARERQHHGWELAGHRRR